LVLSLAAIFSAALAALIARFASVNGRATCAAALATTTAMVGVSVFAIFETRLRINFTPSMPLGIYRLEPLPTSGVTRGMVVAACAPGAAADLGRRRGYLSSGPCADDTEPLLKVVAGAPGDRVAVSAEGVAVNGCPLSDSRPIARDRAGRLVSPWPRGDFRLGQGQVWLYASNPRSWDSRYWGPAPVAGLLAVAVPLLTGFRGAPGCGAARFAGSASSPAFATVIGGPCGEESTLMIGALLTVQPTACYCQADPIMQPSTPPQTGIKRQPPRPIPPRLAAVVEYLELFQPGILTLQEIGFYLRELGMDDDPASVARELQRHGWLLPLRTKGRWEFAPGARAGAIPSADPFIELRATLQRRSLPVALAYDSAAWLQGLSARQPVKQVLATYPNQRKLPPALSNFRITRIWSVLEPESKDHLPVWRVPTLLAKMAIVPHYYRDWPNVMEWLEEAFKRADLADLERELDVAPDTARVRLAYLADRANFKYVAEELMKKARPKGLVYLGRDRSRSHFVREYNLIDSLLVPSVKA